MTGRLSEWERGVLASAMTPGSCAMMMGRSVRWVERMRIALNRATGEIEATVTEPPAAGEPVQARAGRVSTTVVHRDQDAARATVGRVVRAAGRRIDAPPPQAAPRPSRRMARASPPRMVRLKPITADIVRWAGWFVAAGWGESAAAELFDVDEGPLAEALGLRVAA